MNTDAQNYVHIRDVPTQVADACEALFTRDIAIQGCYQLLNQNLFGRGLIVQGEDEDTPRSTKKKKHSPPASPSKEEGSEPNQKKRKSRTPLSVMEPTGTQVTPHFTQPSNEGLEALGDTLAPEFQAFISKRYNGFLEQAFRHLLCFGYFVWTEHTSTEIDKNDMVREVKYPAVVPNGAYRVRVGMREDYSFDWKVYPVFTGSLSARSIESGPDPRLHIFLLTDYHPHEITCAFRSTLSILLKPASYMDDLMTERMNAERLRGRPMVWIEFEEAKKETRLGGLSDGMYANVDVLKSFSESAANEAQSSASKAFVAARENEMYFSARDPVHLQSVRYSEPTSDAPFDVASERYQPQVVCVPRGLRVATQPPAPQVATDILDFEAQRLEHVSFIMGVPVSLSSSGRTTPIKADAADFRRLSRTIKYWQARLVSAVTDVFHTINPPSEGGFVKFRLPMIPYVEQLTMLQLVDQDIIKSSSAARYLAHAHGMEEDDVLDDGERNLHTRPTIWGTERSTETFIKTDASLKQSEVVLNEALAEKGKADAKAALMPKPASS